MRFVYQILKPGTMVDNDGNLYVVYPVTTSYIEPSGKHRCPFCDYVFVKYTSGSGSVTKSTPLMVDIERELRAFYGFGGAGTSDNWGWRDTPYLLTHDLDDFRWGYKGWISLCPSIAQEDLYAKNKADSFYVTILWWPSRFITRKSFNSDHREGFFIMTLKKSDMSYVSGNFDKIAKTNPEFSYNNMPEWHQHFFNHNAIVSFHDIDNSKIYRCWFSDIMTSNDFIDTDGDGDKSIPMACVASTSARKESDVTSKKLWACESEPNNTSLQSVEWPSGGTSYASYATNRYCCGISSCMFKSGGYVWGCYISGFFPYFVGLGSDASAKKFFRTFKVSGANESTYSANKSRVAYCSNFSMVKYNGKDYFVCPSFSHKSSSLVREPHWSDRYFCNYSSSDYNCQYLGIYALSTSYKTLPSTYQDSKTKEQKNGRSLGGPPIATDTILYRTSIIVGNAEPKNDNNEMKGSTLNTLYRNTHAICFYKDYMFYAYCYPGRAQRLILGYAPWWISDNPDDQHPQFHLGTKINFVKTDGSSFCSEANNCSRILSLECRNGHVWIIWASQESSSGVTFYYFHAKAEDLINS